MNFRRPARGFTYIELLVTMVIVVTLYAVVLGPSEATKRRRAMAECAENLRKLHLTLNLYANEHRGEYPMIRGAKRTEDALRVLAPKYTTDATYFTCPVPGGGYSYAMGLKNDGPRALLAADRLASSNLSRGAALFSTSGNHGDTGGNLLFTDGHVESAGATAPSNLPIPPGVVLIHP